MKIGVFFESMPKEIGGGFTFQETVLSGLGNLPHQFVVFHYGDAPELKSTNVSFHSLGGRITRFCHKLRYGECRQKRRAFRFRLNRALGRDSKLPAISALDKAARKNNIDLVWYPTPSAQLTEIPYIATIWDLEHRAQPYFPEMSANGEWEGRDKYFSSILPRASYVITGTEIGKKEIKRFYGVASDRIRLLKHPTPDFAMNNTAAAGSAPKQKLRSPYIFYAAQFWAHKNHVTLLKAVSLLRKEGKIVDLALVGSDKGNRSFIEALAKELGIEDQIKFLGFVSRDELIYLYKNALALTYSSLCGPENLPPLEAFALGCPVIASDISGSREQLGEAAMLIPALDETAWAEAVKKLLNDSALRNKFITSGKQRALAYTSKHFIGDMGSLFTEFAAIRALWR